MSTATRYRPGSSFGVLRWALAFVRAHPAVLGAHLFVGVAAGAVSLALVAGNGSALARRLAVAAPLALTVWVATARRVGGTVGAVDGEDRLCSLAGVMPCACAVILAVAGAVALVAAAALVAVGPGGALLAGASLGVPLVATTVLAVPAVAIDGCDPLVALRVAYRVANRRFGQLLTLTLAAGGALAALVVAASVQSPPAHLALMVGWGAVAGLWQVALARIYLRATA